MRYTRYIGLMALIVAAAWGASGCACPYRVVKLERGGKDADLVRTTYQAVDCLLYLMPADSAPDPKRRVLVATSVNLDEVRDTSTFGRLNGELLAARLAQKGYSVVHLTIRQGSVAINDQGQFALSRDIQKLAANYDTGAVLVSTYTLAPEKVFISLKLVNAEANTVVSAIDYAIPKGPQTQALLGGGGTASSGGSYYDQLGRR
ncbi:MAG: hypothetical protein JXO22_07920 [Phycisphaerae bacterium]|nr:hypothetical protein [Phycisphaerae bacterium]